MSSINPFTGRMAAPRVAHGRIRLLLDANQKVKGSQLLHEGWPCLCRKRLRGS